MRDHSPREDRVSAIDEVQRLQPERYKSVWRTEVAVRHNELLHRLGSARAGKTSPLPKRMQTHLDAAKDALADARRAVNQDGWLLLAWLTGTAVTAGWEALHDAEGELALLEDDDDVRAALPRLLAWTQQVAPAGDLRARYERLLGEYIDGAPIDRTVVRQAYQDAQIANNEWHASLRAFRNLLLAASAVLATALIALAAWHAINPEFVSLCGSDEAGAGARRCLTGDSPSGRDVLQVEVVGVLGGLLSVAFGLGAVKVQPSRYNLRAAQAALKPLAGAATALIGVLLVQSNVLIAPAETLSESLLLAYAAIFGFSQQLLTQFVDRRAGELLTGPNPDSAQPH
jgi:hypothetical protein